MVSIRFVHPDGREDILEVAEGTTLMHAATTTGIDGIVAECGGSAMCATCHVYVDEQDLQRVPPIGEVENEMLASTAAERRPTSRLSCQVIVTRDMNGLLVHLPVTQI